MAEAKTAMKKRASTGPRKMRPLLIVFERVDGAAPKVLDVTRDAFRVLSMVKDNPLAFYVDIAEYLNEGKANLRVAA